MLSIIVAMGENRVIGKDNDMPWHLPNDLRYFKERTLGHTIIMGRKTFESLGRVLPNRKHVVITRSDVQFPEGVEVIKSIDEIIEYANNQTQEEVFIIGGGEIFKQMLPHVDRLYVTLIQKNFTGDVYFPKIDVKKWELVEKTVGLKDKANPYDYEFLVYEQKK